MGCGVWDDCLSAGYSESLTQRTEKSIGDSSIHHEPWFKLFNTVVVLVIIFAILLVEFGHTNSVL